MKLRNLAGWLALAACMALSGGAMAYTPEALASYNAGRQFQAARQWTQAVAAYNAALKADASLTAAYKALGTVYYQAGDRKGALYYYDRYLAYYPNDQATKTFAGQLRASLAAPAPAGQGQGAAPSRQAGAGGAGGQAGEQPFKQRWGVSVNGAYNSYAFTDWNSTYGPSSAAGSFSSLFPGSSASGSDISSGYSFGGSVDYQCLRNFMLALDVDYYLAGSSLSVTVPDGSLTENATFKFNFPVIWVGPSAYVVFPDLIPDVHLRFGGGAGYVFLIGASGTYDFTSTQDGSSVSNNNTSTYSGNTIGAKFDVGLDWFFNPGYSLGLDFGYRMASIGKVTESPAFLSDNGTLLQANGSNLPFDYSGIFLQASIANWF